MDLMTEKTKQQLAQEESERAVAEFLAAGGKIQYIDSGTKSDPANVKSAWGRRPKAPPKPVVVKKARKSKTTKE
jgi:hypothetical protein